ncbi:MAG: hypothetical protein OIN88_16960 [Candidatus Methanoperedens sp.]|nr:hypothetical protein [Candidatus Methanoperedens sp.]
MAGLEEIEEVYKKLEDKLPFNDFKSMVEEKIAVLNGLCDSRTAALLVAGELGVSDTVKIKDMTPDQGNVVFIAKVLSLGEIREFSRDNDTIGRVVNLSLADETGTIRASLWDEASDLVKQCWSGREHRAHRERS